MKNKIISFKPPFSTNFKANIAKILFKLLCKYFTETNKLYQLFNNNTAKISYRWMRNMSFIISAHNQILLTPSNSFLDPTVDKKVTVH